MSVSPSIVDRRMFLTTGGLAAAGFALGSCASRTGGARTIPHPPVRLTPVQVSWDRIIRTTVGLRPHRDSGFLLAPSKLDDKLVIHNYGHGGSGMSISWGTGAMAADFALAHQD